MAAPVFALHWAKSCFTLPPTTLFKQFTLTNICPKSLNFTRYYVTRNSYTISANQTFSRTSPSNQNHKISFSTSTSCNSEKSFPGEDKDSGKSLIPLMEFPEIVWPSVLKTFKNIIQSRLIIRMHFDPEFNINSFVVGAKQAVVRVSKILSEGNAEDLRGLVTDEAIEEIKPNLARMSLKQRQELHMLEKDIYFGFVYLVGIMFDETTEIQRRYAEITTCFHCIRNFEDISRPEGTFSDIQAARDRISIANYRFICEYTQGVEREWIINKLNHFHPDNV